MPRRTCGECGRVLDELMAVHEDSPGVFEILRGDAGELARLVLILSLCILAALAYAGAEALLR